MSASETGIEYGEPEPGDCEVTLRVRNARPGAAAHRRTAAAAYALAAAVEDLSGAGEWCVSAHPHDGDLSARVRIELVRGSDTAAALAVARRARVAVRAPAATPRGLLAPPSGR